MKNPLLVRQAQPGEQRQNARVSQIPAFQFFRHLTYFAFSGKEDKHIPAVVQSIQPIHGTCHMSRKFLIVILWRQIVEVHRISAAFYLNYRCASKEFGKPAGIQRRGTDDQPQVSPPVQQKPQIAEQKVNVEAAFMRLIQNQGMILAQIRIMLRFRQKNPIRHELQARIRPGFFLKAHLVTHQTSQVAVQFLRHSAGNGSSSQPSGLGAPYSAPHLPGKLHGHFRELGSLTGSRLPHYDNDLVLPHCRQNIIPAAGNG